LQCLGDLLRGHRHPVQPAVAIRLGWQPPGGRESLHDREAEKAPGPDARTEDGDEEAEGCSGREAR